MEYWDIINEAIVRLRGRKNRPDVDNILNVLNKKKPTISKNVLENALNQLEKHNKLYRVYYKGHTSYRQTAFKDSSCDGDDKKANQNGSFSSDTEEDTEDKSEAFGRPIADEDMSQDTVVTPTPLDDVLQDRSALSSDSDSVQDRPGMGRKRPRSTEPKDPMKIATIKSRPVTSSLPLTAARVSSRKRIKKTHGPDWQTDILHLECKVQLSTCAVCRSKDVSGNLLSCSACKVHVHARCLQLTERSVAKISANKQFYCLRCKPCKLCHYALEVSERDRGSQVTVSLASIMEGGDMIHCCQCYSVFHLGCLRPALPAKPKGQPWMCRKCSYEANKKEKLKANAAATAMLMVAQQRPLIQDKSDRSPLSEKDKDLQECSRTSRDSEPNSPPGGTTGNNENSLLRNGHIPDTKAVVSISQNGALHSNGSKLAAVGSPAPGDSTTEAVSCKAASPDKPAAVTLSPATANATSIVANGTAPNTAAVLTNNSASASVTIDIGTTPCAKQSGAAKSAGEVALAGAVVSCSPGTEPVAAGGTVTIVEVEANKGGCPEPKPDSAKEQATVTSTAVKEELLTVVVDRKPSELRKKLLESAGSVVGRKSTAETKSSELPKEQAGNLKIEEQGRQLVFIAGKSPANTKVPALPTLPRCELTFHIPKQLSLTTTPVDGATLTSLACSTPGVTPTITTTATTPTLQHVIPVSGPIAGPAGNFTPIVITSIPSKVHPEDGAPITLTAQNTLRAPEGLALSNGLPQIQLMPLSLATAVPAAPAHSPPTPIVSSSQPEPPAQAADGGGKAAKLAQFAVYYPNVSEWSAAQVAQFLAEMGYEKESKVFVEQEIDGASLLLLKRMDVLSTLGLKLGPAVKIFQHISNLQEVVQS